jgi:predicted nucleic acid-binding protein
MSYDQKTGEPMQSVLIDTDIAIDYLRGSEEAACLLEQLWKNNIAHLSILSVYELYAGMRATENDVTEDFIDACNIEPVTMQIAKKAGDIYRHWRRKGVTITSIDCLIAVTAVLNKHKIATRNKGHYREKGLLLGQL